MLASSSGDLLAATGNLISTALYVLALVNDRWTKRHLLNHNRFHPLITHSFLLKEENPPECMADQKA